MAKSTDVQSLTFRASFPHLSTPNEYDNKLTYQVDAIFDPATAGQMQQLIQQTAHAMIAQEFPGQEAIRANPTRIRPRTAL